MTDPTPGADPATIARLATEHGIDIDESSIRVEELGLDFRVAIGRARDGEQWVLRIPRRPDVAAQATVEARVLAAVAPHLTVAVPDWRVHTANLVAYPLLPGEPGLTIKEDGSPQWHIDLSSPAYAASLGDLLAELHGIDPDPLRAIGIPHRSPAEVRAQWRSGIATVTAEFAVSAELTDRWDAWLSDDSYWPDFSVLTHGEIYPAHTLTADESITAVLDWTTAGVGDPGKDFMFHRVTAPQQAFDATVRRYVERGGRVWSRLAEHCTELFAASPISHGLYALQTGEQEHRDAAAAQLNPQLR